MRVTLKRKHGYISKNFRFPGDKSIAHRALIIGALGKGNYTVKNFPKSLDCMATLDCVSKLGVDINIQNNIIEVSSPGYQGFNKYPGKLYANNSGTTARLLSGLVAGCGIQCTIDGDNSLRKRPMDRVIIPLEKMGSNIESINRLLPINFNNNGRLSGIDYFMPVSSAQVKSCVLIAGFLAEGETKVVEKESTRDHTERMFQALGADISIKEKEIFIRNSSIAVQDMFIPGDISSAAFLIACALLSENSEVIIKDILLNERRRKYLNILNRMGADINYEVTDCNNWEETGYILAKSSSLKGIVISKEEVPDIIDEIPVLSVLAAFSRGKTIINGIKELKYKESNRIKAIAENLKICGLNVSFSDDYIEIDGIDEYIHKDININPNNDHRIALAFAALAVRNLGDTTINQWECTSVSLPDALEYFKEFLDISLHQ